MFNNHHAETNGELLFYKKHKDEFNVIFDVGSRSDSIFLTAPAEVYYFEPVAGFLEALKQDASNHNTKSHFLNFGLSDENTTLPYYDIYQSFCDRTKSCGDHSKKHVSHLEVRRADYFILKNNITQIDFLKIDTEGYEWKVLKGFGDKLTIVKVIQFEYGGTFIDNGVRLKDLIGYLKHYDFDTFSYLSPDGLVPIRNDDDHYQYCNIVCFNRRLFATNEKR